MGPSQTKLSSQSLLQIFMTREGTELGTRPARTPGSAGPATSPRRGPGEQPPVLGSVLGDLVRFPGHKAAITPRDGCGCPLPGRLKAWSGSETPPWSPWGLGVTQLRGGTLAGPRGATAPWTGWQPGPPILLHPPALPSCSQGHGRRVPRERTGAGDGSHLLGSPGSAGCRGRAMPRCVWRQPSDKRG